MQSAELRALFLDFFQKKGHTLVPSAPLVPQKDPTLLFTSAGMVPFKDFFMEPQKSPYPRATSAQKCVRAGGKHNDLEQVGYTQRHHTFFEMLGNFSFGDYFKEASIAYAWEFLTQVLGLPRDRLWVTVYHTDREAMDWWKKIAGLGEDRLIPIATADNFWSAGDVGPCGPCSEIFYDHGAHLWGGLPGTPEEDGDRYVELWNLVFMQFDQVGPEERVALPLASIDTGMGLERIAAVMQGVSDNFETDIFKAIISQSVNLCPATASAQGRVAHRVMADHLRSSSFLLAEGVLPSNEGRGYVVRRILRRALRHGHYLGASTGHLAKLLPTLVDRMGQAYPELARAQELIASVLTQEAEQFDELLRKGLQRMAPWLDRASKGDVFPGREAFTLYDTFGFPLDLTQDILRERGCTLHEGEFQEHMQAQREQSRACWVGSGSCAKAPLWESLRDRLEKTEFLGYGDLSADSTVVALLREDEEVASLEEGTRGCMVTAQTPFYPESGGQVGDGGTFTWCGGEGEVLHTVKKGPLIVHEVHVLQGCLPLQGRVHLQVDGARRRATAAHHSATHLLQAALRRVLGKHVMQKGSLVEGDGLRFDFSHGGAVSAEDLRAVEDLINGWILENIPIVVQSMDKEKAMTSGAMAFFGEQYEEVVRVVSMGEASMELCGGTHGQRTGDLGQFKILSESGVAAGVRRIEAVVGLSALRRAQEWQDHLRRLAGRLKTSIPLLGEKIEALMAERQRVKSTPTPMAWQQSPLGSYTLWHASAPTLSIKDMKAALDQIKGTLTSGVMAITSKEGEKGSIVVGVTADIAHLLDASLLLRGVLEPLGLSGGGRRDLAQGGGSALPDHGDCMALLIQHGVELCAKK